MTHKYSIVTDGEHAVKIIDENGAVIQRGIDGREKPDDKPSHFKAWKQATRIRDAYERQPESTVPVLRVTVGK